MSYSFFATRRVLQFPADDVEHLGDKSILTTCKVYGKPLLFDINPKTFTNRAAYDLLMFGSAEVSDNPKAEVPEGFSWEEAVKDFERKKKEDSERSDKNKEKNVE